MKEGETELAEEEPQGERFQKLHRAPSKGTDRNATPSAGLAAAAGPEVNEGLVAQLMETGFSRVRCVKALLATGNSTADAAMDWLIAHMEDAGERASNRVSSGR